ncbi:MAG TPA: hypothetical protein VGK46_11040 [Saprospiraceae bacterium]|jgi:hypothetical protein
MGAAKLAIKTKYQPGRNENDPNDYCSNYKSLPDLFPEEAPPDPISRGIRDLVNLKAIAEFPFLFFHLYIAKLIIDKKGIIAGGGDGKIYDHNTGIAIDQQMTGIIAMEQADFVAGAIVSYICPGHLAHSNIKKAT